MQLESRDYVWALHSQSQDLLLERCIRLCDNTLVWQDARNLGLFIWLQKIDVVVSDSVGALLRILTLNVLAERPNGHHCKKYILVKIR